MKKDDEDVQYLQKRRQGWYVRVAVPLPLRPILRKQAIVKSLGTRDLREAQRRRWEARAEIERMFSAARSDKPPEEIMKEALEFRSRFLATNANTPLDDQGHTQRDDWELIALGVADEHEQKYGTEVALRAFKVMTGEGLPTSVALDQWLKDEAGKFAQGTVADHRNAVGLFVGFTGDVLVGQVDRRLAGRFVVEKLKGDGKASPRTVAKKISSLSSFWRWLGRRGHIDFGVNPWEGQGDYSREAKRTGKRPYRPQELVKMLRADPKAIYKSKTYGPAIYDLIRLGLLTGARLDELCSLKVGDVDEAARIITIPKGKTENAPRNIPVHDLIWPIVHRRLNEARDGFLFWELPPGGPDQKRGWTTTKRFTAFRRRVLGDTGRELDFHSFRRCFATYLERASTKTAAVNDSVIAELMGHQKKPLAARVYSGGLGWGDSRNHQLHRDAIEALASAMEVEVIEAI